MPGSGSQVIRSHSRYLISFSRISVIIAERILLQTVVPAFDRQGKSGTEDDPEKSKKIRGDSRVRRKDLDAAGNG